MMLTTKSLVALMLCMMTIKSHAQHHVQRGVASWYGSENSTSCTGRKLSHNTPQVAHRTLPIGSKVRITSLTNGRSVGAVVVDRGPFTKHRIVDVNRFVARRLLMIKSGTDRVMITVVSTGK